MMTVALRLGEDAAPAGIVGSSEAAAEPVSPPSCPHLVPHRYRPGTIESVAEPVEAEQADVVARRALGGKVGQDLSDDRCELVAVP